MKVIPYSTDSLAEALTNKYTSASVIKDKEHFKYLTGYLAHPDIAAETIVEEENYISKDFLHDFAAYYALCFEPYPKQCKRVHFFRDQFDQSKFEQVLLANQDDNGVKLFWEGYLGFIVVKPIPVTVIGYTVLRTYAVNENSEYNARKFWGTRKYIVNVFGSRIELDSLAFQEQDTILAACATTAIWSMLNKASLDYHTILKSPADITKDADNVSPDGSRLFPNRGLDMQQICQAILNSGLVSEIKQPDTVAINPISLEKEAIVSGQYLRKIINAYAPVGIPIILVVNVPNGNVYGLHAITISGFSRKEPASILPKPEVSWYADTIEKFYAHDDQFGPFVKVEFLSNVAIRTPWTRSHASHLSTFATNIVVPLFPKIRISYEDIEIIVLGLDTIFSFFMETKIKADLTWNIRIDYSEKLKAEIKTSVLDDQEKLKLMTKSMPKYIWIASCSIGEVKLFDFVFDATDVSNGMIGKEVLCYLADDSKNELRNHLLANRRLHEYNFKHKASPTYYQFIIDKLDSF